MTEGPVDMWPRALKSERGAQRDVPKGPLSDVAEGPRGALKVTKGP